MAWVQILDGQSNYDICLKVYGSLDMLVKLCKDNSVENLNRIQSKQYYYDESLVVDSNVTGYNYKTKPSTLLI